MNHTPERRGGPRHRFSCRAHFRLAHAPCAGPEQTCITRDFSRDGIYFIAEDLGLRERMRLLLRFPELLPAVPDQDYLVEVMRIKSLPEDRCGVGARLILRDMVDRCAAAITPAADRGYGCLYTDSRRLVDLYA